MNKDAVVVLQLTANEAHGLLGSIEYVADVSGELTEEEESIHSKLTELLGYLEDKDGD